MASGYDLKYTSIKKGEEWKPEILAGALDKRRAFAKLNPQSGKDLETIANNYISPVLLTTSSEEDIARAVKGYGNFLDSATNDYVLSNLKSAVGYADQQRLIPIALNLPTKKRKAKEGQELSEEDKKYNGVVDAVLKMKEIAQARQSKEGLAKEVEKEFEGATDISKKFWLSYWGAEKVYAYRQEKAQNAAIKSIIGYGLAPYFSAAIKVSDSAESEFADKSKKLETTLTEEVKAIKTKTGLDATPLEVAKIRDKYTPEIEKLQKEYSSLLGAKQFILNGAEEMPGLISLVEGKYLADKKQKEAEEAAKKKAEEAAKAKK
jgi:hypothetical protein